MAKAYWVAAYRSISDPDKLAAYAQLAAPAIAAGGGRFLARGGTLTVLEGEWPHERTVVLEFPSREKAEAWYHSPAYQKILPLRLRCMTSSFVIMDGV